MMVFFVKVVKGHGQVTPGSGEPFPPVVAGNAYGYPAISHGLDRTDHQVRIMGCGVVRFWSGAYQKTEDRGHV